MPSSVLNGVLRELRRVTAPAGGELTDGELLERFLVARAEDAFEALVRRHGPMVMGVCRRALSDLQDAEDAFQATFLVLVRKASSVADRESVGSWLYEVALRTARKARTAAARRREKEKQMARPEALPEDDLGHELRSLIDQEVSRLPGKYREPVVLCDLEGQTRKEAARQLGWPEGTVSGRLARARVLLAKRLARHGLTLSGGALAVVLSQNAARAALPALLVSSTVRAAALVAAGQTAIGAVSAPVAALTEGVVQAMSLSKVKSVLAVLLTVGLIGTGWGAYQAPAEEPAKAPVPPPAVKALPAARAPVVGAPVVGAPMNPKIGLPTGPALTQVLASIGPDGKLVIKTATRTILRPNVRPALPINPGGGGGAGGAGAAVPAVARIQLNWEVRSQTYDLSDITVLDTKNKKLDKKDVAKLLKAETVAMASMYGQPVDPLHLRVLKDGILVFVLPAQNVGPRIGQPGLRPAPAVPPGAGRAVPGAPPALFPAPQLNVP